MRVLLATELDLTERERIRNGFPGVEFVEEYDQEKTRDSIAGCEVMLAGRITPELLDAASSLKWIMVRSAGVNHLPMEDIARRGILLTNGSGAHGVPIAENTLAMMLAFATGLYRLIRAQESRQWIAGEVAPKKFELEGQTLLIAGLGDLGITLAGKAKGLGMRIVGVRKSTLDRPEEVDELIPRGRIHEALGQADHVALCLPLTRETTGFLDEHELSAMKPTAYVYNAGRGESIRREALIRALTESWIAGAGLDTTDPEPLPQDDPLWSFPNVILSQHTSGSSPMNSRRIADLFMDNLRRYRAGEPLLNLVDPERRY